METCQSTFTVTLTVTDENGCTDTHTEEVTINEVPDPIIVDPTFSFVSCSGENEFTVSVLDQSIPADNANYTIDWGDGPRLGFERCAQPVYRQPHLHWPEHLDPDLHGAG